MKRTAEKILIISGIIINIIVIIYSFLSLNRINSTATKNQLHDALSSNNDSSLSVNQVIEQLQTLLITLGCVGIISIILGVISLILLKKRTKISGIILIIASIVSLNPVIFILWIISALMLFLKKKQEIIDSSWNY